MTSMLVDEGPAVVLRSKTNPFQDVPHDKKAVKVKEGLLQRKIHADVDGKRSEFLSCLEFSLKFLKLAFKVFASQNSKKEKARKEKKNCSGDIYITTKPHKALTKACKFDSYLVGTSQRTYILLIAIGRC